MREKLMGAVAVILDPEGRVLLLQRGSGATWMPLKWAPPGGLIEPGESPEDAVIRETKEETTLDIERPTEFLTSPNGEIVYFVTRRYKGTCAIDFEHDDFAWVYPEELTNYDIVPQLAYIIHRGKEALSYG